MLKTRKGKFPPPNLLLLDSPAAATLSSMPPRPPGRARTVPTTVSHFWGKLEGLWGPRRAGPWGWDFGCPEPAPFPPAWFRPPEPLRQPRKWGVLCSQIAAFNCSLGEAFSGREKSPAAASSWWHRSGGNEEELSPEKPQQGWSEIHNKIFPGLSGSDGSGSRSN